MNHSTGLCSALLGRLGQGLAIATLVIAGCAGPASSGGDGGGGNKDGTGGGGADIAVCATKKCMGLCDPSTEQTDCTDPAKLKCDPGSSMCVQCVTEKDCAVGLVCGPGHTCVPGCSVNHGCPSDGGVCEVDGGSCVECLGDPDCVLDPNKTRCDPVQHRCFACNPTNDNCGSQQYCAQSGNDFSCSAGCKDDTDCKPMQMMGGADGGGGGDGGGGSDGGARDGGGGGGVDGGMKGNGGLNFCDKPKHTCVQCLTDDQCPAGKLCKADVCVPGCTGMHMCDNALACCGMPGMQNCVDTTSDFQNCGGCGNQCQGGWNCCGSMCSNPLNDLQNCGTCGTTCTVAHGTPACVQRACTIAKCDQGYANCVGGGGGMKDLSCETHIDVNVNNCGACNNPCTIAHGAPKCVGGTCQIASCDMGWGNCNGNVGDGCETNLTNDPTNCGACGAKCSGAHISQPTCGMGVCNGQCDVDFADCKNDKANTGCQTNIAADTQNCGACGKTCANTCVGNVMSTTCGKGLCSVTMCAPGTYDLDMQCANGCECKSIAAASTCQAPVDLGTIGFGASTQSPAANLVGMNVDAWYRVKYVDNLAAVAYHPQVVLMPNPGNEYRFDIYVDCAGNKVTCNDGGPNTGITQWEVNYTAMNPPADPNSKGWMPIPPGGNGGTGTFYIKVYRAGGIAVDCNAYQVLVSNK